MIDEETTPVPPQSLEAEESILGAMMLSPSAIGAVSEILEPTDFYRESHEKIYRGALSLYATGGTVDSITLVEHLDERGDLLAAGGKQRLHELAALVPATANAAHYARIVREMSMLRDMIRVGAEISRRAMDRSGETEELLELAEREVYDIRRGQSHQRPLADDLTDLLGVWQDLAENPREILGVPSGFNDLDKITHGFMPGTLNVLAARPAMGKTALALGLAGFSAVAKDIPTTLFSLEMSKVELLHRMVAMGANVDNTRLRHSWMLEQAEWTRILASIQRLAAAPLTIYDDGLIRPQGMRSRLRRDAARQEAGLVIVDYIQLMASDRKSESLTEDVTHISRALKVMAREFDVPVVALSQLSRQVEHRTDKRPVLSDLRQSGAIEQDADLVMFLYRDSYYNPDSMKGNTVEVNVAKHRNGQTNMVELDWIPEKVKFTSLWRPGL